MNNYPIIQGNIIQPNSQTLNATHVGTATRISAEMGGGDFELNPIGRTNIFNNRTNNLENRTNIFDYILDDLKQSSPPKQVAIGGFSGWVLGCILRKIGRTTLLAIGGGFVIITVAQQQGFAEIDWPGIQNRCITIRDNLHLQFFDNSPQMQKIQETLRKYTYFTASFVGGFILGFAM